MNRPLGCLTGSGITVALLTGVVATVASFASHNGIFSPGGLNAVAGANIGGVQSHAELEPDCAACHPPFWAAEGMGNRCLNCHTEIADEIGNPTRLHGELASPGNCRDCHTEHHGPAGNLTTADTVDFRHEVVGFSLFAHQTSLGRNALSCRDCHTQSLLTFQFETCADCHSSLDASLFGEHILDFGLGCFACHDGLDSYGASWSHGTTNFPLDGAHREISCYRCHPQSTTMSDLRATPQACVDCHQSKDIHVGRLGEDCGSCHGLTSWQEAIIDHSLTGFSLEASHAQMDCLACHENRQWTGIPRTCFGCHASEDAHAGRLGQDCGACHTAASWQDASMDHALAAFKLEASHAQVDCTDCHVNRQWTGIPRNCYGCHARDDVHSGQFGTQCEACHRPTTWSDWTFDHNLSAFPLTGAHRSLPCGTCHNGNSFRGTPKSCAACHGEPAFHAGLFSSSCDSCHSTSAWRPASYSGPHTFPMNHGGARSDCFSCHPSTLASYTCYACHDQGEMTRKHQEEGISSFSDCIRCHPTGNKGGGDGDD